MLNARKVALALQYVRSVYATNAMVASDSGNGAMTSFLIEPGTIIVDNAETNDVDAPYTDDDTVTLTYEDGSVYRLELVKVK